MNKYLTKLATKFWDAVRTRVSKQTPKSFVDKVRHTRIEGAPLKRGKARTEETITQLRLANQTDYRPVMPTSGAFSKIYNSDVINNPRKTFDGNIRRLFKTSKPADPKQTYTGKGHLVDRLINKRVEQGQVYPGGRHFELGALRAKVTKLKGPSIRTAQVEMVKKRQRMFDK